MSDEEKQIERLKSEFRSSIDKEYQKKVLDSLILYRDPGITAITELINNGSCEQEVKS